MEELVTPHFQRLDAGMEESRLRADPVDSPAAFRRFWGVFMNYPGSPRGAKMDFSGAADLLKVLRASF